MYIFKNALRSISRSKGRNILIGIIILVIAVSSCVALSIREAAETAREDSLGDLEITAQITTNRQSMMENMEDRESMKEALSSMEGLSLEEMQQYAESEYVKDFYYTASVSLNGSDDFEAVDTTGIQETTDETESSDETAENASSEISQMMEGMMGGMSQMGEQAGAEQGGMAMMGRMGTQGDFTVTGYSSDSAMTDFLEGTKTIVDGEMFAENDAEGQCVINQELATYNGLEVGDEIVLTNPNDEEETYTFTVSGIYESNSAEESFGNMMGGFSASFDTANQIYTSYENLQLIVETSEENAEVTTDETTGRETTTAVQSQTTGTYAFTDVDQYEKFKEAAEAELGENYSVTSSDVTQYEQSLLPLENLSKYAGYFLMIILIIGGIILVVLNIFNVRERKYEIGVLAAIGMKKSKIAIQFIVELLCVTFIAIIIGAGAGAVISVPVANALLEQQVESSEATEAQQMSNFGREPGMSGGGMQNMPGSEVPDMPDGSGASNEIADMPDESDSGFMNPFAEKASQYITSIDSATNLTVVLQLMGIGILLTIVAGCVAVISILRYDPLRILSNRD